MFIGNKTIIASSGVSPEVRFREQKVNVTLSKLLLSCITVTSRSHRQCDYLFSSLRGFPLKNASVFWVFKFCEEIHRTSVDSPHGGLVMWIESPDVIIFFFFFFFLGGWGWCTIEYRKYISTKPTEFVSNSNLNYVTNITIFPNRRYIFRIFIKNLKLNWKHTNAIY